MLSAVYLVAFLMQGAIALLLGAIATAVGLKVAIDLGAGGISVLSVCSIALTATISDECL